jgi:hypothetical protein
MKKRQFTLVTLLCHFITVTIVLQEPHHSIMVKHIRKNTLLLPPLFGGEHFGLGIDVHLYSTMAGIPSSSTWAKLTGRVAWKGRTAGILAAADMETNWRLQDEGGKGVYGLSDVEVRTSLGWCFPG